MQNIEVIRIGHRKERDIRVTTHCALVARAFGAKKVTVCGERAPETEKSVKGVNQNWGKGIEFSWEKNFRNALKRSKREKKVLVHLTMYGEPFEKRLNVLKKAKKLAIVVGAEKVPRDVYEKSDYNLSVTSQPHSEIAALSILLYALTNGKASFTKAKLKIIPKARGKRVERKKARFKTTFLKE